MTNLFYRQPTSLAGRRWALAGWLCCCWLLAATTWAQVPTWVVATTGGSAPTGSTSTSTAVATDASGNVFVTGYFTGTVLFGSASLSSLGGTDLFVAKYVPATNTWAWAQRGGGTGADAGLGIAVSGGRVYLTGYLTNNVANASGVTFGGAATPSGTAVQAGAASGVASRDLVLAAYIDSGTSAALAWTQVAGGTDTDEGHAVGVNENLVYVTGYLTNSTTNANSVVFGGSGTTPGTSPQYGANAAQPTLDLVLAKYTDLGSNAVVTWTQLAGGMGNDGGFGLCVSGTSVYVTGNIFNDTANSRGVVFGGAGTTAGTQAQAGATNSASADLLLAKYVDNGPTAAVAWTQVGGGYGFDSGQCVAVSNNRVYLGGHLYNNSSNILGARFGGGGLAGGTVMQPGASSSVSFDWLVASYTDNGTGAALNWTQVGGGLGADYAYGLVASGSTLYAAGFSTNSATNASQVLFGGTPTATGSTTISGTSPATSADILVVQYLDQGSTATVGWTQIGGGPGSDYGFGLASYGTRLYVAGAATLPASFGSLTVSNGASSSTNFLGGLDSPAALATTPASVGITPRLYPNPAAGPATLQGATPGTPVHVFDALGRRVGTAAADASGAAALPAGIAPGVYLVRAGAGTVRWVVE